VFINHIEVKTQCSSYLPPLKVVKAKVQTSPGCGNSKVQTYLPWMWQKQSSDLAPLDVATEKF